MTLTTTTAGCWHVVKATRSNHNVLQGFSHRDVYPRRPSSSALSDSSFSPAFATLSTPLRRFRQRGKRVLSAASRNDQQNDYTQDDDLDNHANQMNPNNEAFWTSRGREQSLDDGDHADDHYAADCNDDGNYEYTQADLDNHADQMNPNNDAYWSSRG